MNVAYLCLGGNIGDRKLYLNNAIELISQQIGSVIIASAIYETEAWGDTKQQTYLNCCIKITTQFTSTKLINQLLKIEKQLGRVRDVTNQYQARTIDLDILFFNEEVKKSTKLILPHPRLHLRKFVLMPLAQIAPNLMHPMLQHTIAILLKQCPDTSNVILHTHN